jgi:hypothetical protein
MSSLHILNQHGDTMVEWDLNHPDLIELAAKTFNEAKAMGHLAYAKIDGEFETIHAFDESAEQIIMSAQIVGG